VQKQERERTMENKQEFIEELSYHLSSNASAAPVRPKKQFKRMKFLGKLSPTGMILFVAAIAGAVLISSFFSIYYVQITGELSITGSEAPLFYFDDDIPFVGDTCAVPIDVTEMEAGDVLEFEHNVVNADSGFYLISFDLSDVTYTDPLSPEFGFYFSVTDYAVDGVPCVLEDLIIGPGETAEFTFVYEIDAEMVTPDLPVDVSIGITISPINLAPLTTDDSLSLNYLETKTLDPTLNDVDPEDDDITIVGFETVPLKLVITQISATELSIQSIDGSGGTHTVLNIWVDVSDGVNVVREHVAITTYQPG